MNRTPSNEIEKLFLMDVREKKRIGNNIHSKTGVRGYVGKMRFATDLMTRKEKYNHRKAGKCEVFNMYETILPRNEFELKDEATQKAMLTRWREIYSNEVIMEQMGVKSSGTFHNLMKKLNVPSQKRGKYSKNKKVGTASIKNAKTPHIETMQALETGEIKLQTGKLAPSITQLITNGLNLNYTGEYDSEQLNKIFTKLQLLTDGEPNKFIINISISERV